MKIQMISTHPHGACSYYRTFGVFPKIKDIITESIETVSWQQLSNAEIVFIERPQDPTFVEAARIVKNFGLKVWIDFDDNLFCLPPWNPMVGFYNSKLTRKCILESLKMADVVTVATDSIKEAYQENCQRIEVIPNAFNDDNFDFEYAPSKNKIVMWRGSNTHRGDIMPYVGGIWSAAEKNDEWQFHFIGNDLWYVTENIKNIALTPEMDTIRYFHKIKQVQPSVYIVPLDFNDFNKSKSNCGWLEMTYAGAATLAPDMQEWRKPGILNYQTATDFEEKLNELMNNDILRLNNHKKSFEFIDKNLRLSIVNKQREKIIKSLL